MLQPALQPGPSAGTAPVSQVRSQPRGGIFHPVDVASLVFLRIAFGAILFWHLLTLRNSGAIDALYSADQFHFKYLGFEWVRPWSTAGLSLHVASLCVLALCIMCGLIYRFSSVLFCLGFLYVLLLDRAVYHNHYYLVVLLSGIFAAVPAHRAFSLDAVLWSKLRSQVAPAWALWLMRFQIGLVYVYSGLAKLEHDWLIRCQPVRLLLARETDFPVLGAFFREEWMIRLFNYGGLTFDLSIVPLLLWRRTRKTAFVAATAFHLANVLLFDIGVFPWLMMAMTTVFFDPNWPRRIFQRRRTRQPDVPATKPSERLSRSEDGVLAHRAGSRNAFRRRLALVLLSSYVAVQLLIPLRHYLYPGQPDWTEAGQDFSWRLMQRFKASSDVVFVVTSPRADRTWHVSPRSELTEKQMIRMSGHPDLILEFAHFLAGQMRAAGHDDVQVRALTSVSLNGRKPQMLIDPRVDLAAQRRAWRSRPWILPHVSH